MSKSIIIAAGFALGLAATAATAAPFGAGSGPEAGSLVEKAQSWRYHRSCSWNGKGWFITERGRLVVCRPHSPGRGWIWYSEGPRHGWYHPKRRHWHHNNW